MKNAIDRSVRGLAASLGVLLCALSAGAELPAPASGSPGRQSSTSVQTPETAIASWPAVSQSEARVLIAKYGEPNTFDDDRLVWYDNGQWRRTVVYRKAPQSFMGLHSRDVLEQSVAYAAPDAKLSDLKRFDDRVKFDAATGELSSISENESLNYLALNLADEIVADKRTPQEARDFLAKTVKLAQSGKSSAYTQGLLFQPIQKPTPRIPGEEPAPRGGPIEPPAP